MIVEHNVPLQAYNSFGIVAKARELLRVRAPEDLVDLLADPARAAAPMFVLGGGSNIVLTGDVKAIVLKVEVMGRRVVDEGPRAIVVEAGAGENWHDFVTWTLDQGLPGLENLALIPGSVGATPVQNVGAYGVELQDRFESLDAIDLHTGRTFTLDAAQCAFGYRDSVFKHVAPPAGEDGAADLQYVIAAARSIGRHLDGYCVIVDKSTVPVGTADLVREAIAEELALRGVSHPFRVVSKPEFL